MRHSQEFTLFDAVTATGSTVAMSVLSYKTISASLNTASSASGTIKFQGSTSRTVPDFSAAQSPTNKWDYVNVIDLEDGTSIAGDTGIVLSGTDDNRNLEVNANSLTYFGATITAYAAGAWTFTAYASEEVESRC